MKKNTKQQNAETNRKNKLDILFVRLQGFNYFQGDTVKIDLFREHGGNEHFVKLYSNELKEIRVAEQDGNKTAPNPYRSRDFVVLNRTQEVEFSDLKKLFAEKFQYGKIYYGFKTAKVFAKAELRELELRYTDCFEWFPVFYQWSDFLVEQTTQMTEPLGVPSSVEKGPKIKIMVGSFFASGKIDELRKDQKITSDREIAKLIGYPKQYNYITATSKNTESDKNIFFQPKDVQEVFEFCTRRGITVTDSFRMRYENSF